MNTWSGSSSKPSRLNASSTSETTMLPSPAGQAAVKLGTQKVVARASPAPRASAATAAIPATNPLPSFIPGSLSLRAQAIALAEEAEVDQEEGGGGGGQRQQREGDAD